MANENAAHDANRRKVMLAVDDTTGETVMIPVDANGNLLIAATIADLTVSGGGTGVTSFTAYAPIFGGTTATGALQSGTVGSAGQVLTSNGAGALPTFQAAAGGAPTDATYITQTANGSLSAEQALSSLATGLVQVTTTTGVLSSVTTSAGIAALISDETGSDKLVFNTSPTLVTPTLGVATATSVNKVTITAPATAATLTLAEGSSLVTSGAFSITLTSTAGTNVTLPTTGTLATLAGSEALTNKSLNGMTVTASTGTFTLTNAKTLSVTNTLTLSGTDSTTMTFPSTSATIARTDAAQTFTGTQTFSQVITTNNAITASGNAATVPITSRINTVTNNSAATLTITMTTTSAVEGQLSQVRILDASAAAQTITWVNTEDSTVTAPTTSNGSTTLPLSVLFQFNSATTKWRCIAKA